jgi:hypothetical protein
MPVANVPAIRAAEAGAAGAWARLERFASSLR